MIFGTSAGHLPAVLGGEVSARDLGEDVAVEEAGEDEALGLGVPVKVGHLTYHYLYLYTTPSREAAHRGCGPVAVEVGSIGGHCHHGHTQIDSKSNYLHIYYLD